MNSLINSSFFSNEWAIAIFSGIIVLLFGIFVKRRFQRNLLTDKKDYPTQSQNVNQTLNFFGLQGNVKENASPKSESIDWANLKTRARILFIEDDVFKKIDNLKKFDWTIKQVRSVDNLDIEEIRWANIIFVDYKGVGELSEDQGLGLVKRLKQIFGKEKWIIFYSAHKFPLDVHDKGPNSFLAKNASVYEMEAKIAEGLSNLK